MAENLVTGVVVEALTDSTPPNIRVTGLVAEALNNGAVPNIWVTGIVVEALVSLIDDTPGSGVPDPIIIINT